tara:strand:- start:2563 stop:2889 length:327 start_codon:yes stop_codon:yes gene_type:complete
MNTFEQQLKENIPTYAVLGRYNESTGLGTLPNGQVIPLYYQTPYYGAQVSYPSQYGQNSCSGLLTLDHAYGSGCSNNWKKTCAVCNDRTGFFQVPLVAGVPSHKILNR